MQPDVQPTQRRLSFNSVFVKLAALVAVCAAIVAIALAALASKNVRSDALEALRGKAEVVTDLLGHQAGGALQFRKPEAVDVILLDAIDIAPESVAAIAVTPDGEVLGERVVDGFDTAGMAELGLRAIANAEENRAAAGERADHGDEILTSADGMIVAHPSYFGKNNDITGAIVMRWTPEYTLAAIRADNLQSYLIAGAVFVVAMIAALLMIRAMISRPLTRVNTAMTAVSAGDYAVTVPSTNRSDEIGAVARSLETFRQSLADGEAAIRDGMFKGAAFMGSSAAMMLLDQDFTIRWMNPALDGLLEDYNAAFASDMPEFDRGDLIGKNMDVFHARQPRVRKILSNPENLPFTGEIKLGGESFTVGVSQVADEAGNHVGYVAEWKCVTAEKRNAVLIGAIDANQLRAEITPEGKLAACNPGFAALYGQDSAAAITGKAIGPALTEAGQPAMDRLLGGEPVSGRFELALDSGHTAVLDGSLSPVRDPSGKTVMAVFLASDVTDQSRAIAEAEARRKEMEAAQKRVVDALRVALGKLAEGDLTAEIAETFSADYEQLRVDFNEATRRLLDAMRAVVENAQSIRSEAGEISSASDDLSRRTEKQAATLEETAAALDELTSSVKSAADVAAQANKMVAQAKENAEKSGEVVREAVVAMGEIEESSDKISKITSVIDEIAFQTNLLALNAGVEAARAGEAGRGFAVVASEVRALAQRSSDAAREIAELISASSGQVKRGVDLVDQAGAALTGIQHSVSEIFNGVSEIAVSAQQQSAGLGEINTAVNQLDQVTQQNAAMFEQATAASHALTREAETLTQTTGRFQTGGSFVAANAPAVAAAPAPAAASAQAAPASQDTTVTTFQSRRKGSVPPVDGATALAAEPAGHDDWEEF